MMKKSDLRLITVNDDTNKPLSQDYSWIHGACGTDILRTKLALFWNEEVFEEGFYECGGLFRTRDELVNFMLEKMIEHHGIGLSANQMGLPFRMFVMGRKGKNHSFACFNPRVLGISEIIEISEESCLSIPGIKVDVERPNAIVAEYTNIDGTIVNKPFTGIYARIYQHELDHLDGILITDLGKPRDAERETTNTYS
jgi:peptide deformylase